MQLAIVAAGFTPARPTSCAARWRPGSATAASGTFEQRIIDGMPARGYDAEFAEPIFEQIHGFGEYGFPEIHAAASRCWPTAQRWLKCHEPAVFLAALLNSQPMGFYAPAQLVQDARGTASRCGRSTCCASDWDCTLERAATATTQPARAPGPAPGDRRCARRPPSASSRRAPQAPSRTCRTSRARRARRARPGSAGPADALQSLAGHRRRSSGGGRQRARAAAARRVTRAHEAPRCLPRPRGQDIAPTTRRRA